MEQDFRSWLVEQMRVRHLNQSQLARGIDVARDRDQFGVADWQPSRLVFPNTIGGLLSRSELRDALAGMCAEANVPVISPHGLRHAGASMAIRAGMSPVVVKERLGHSGIAFTLEQYVHPNAADHAAAADVVAELLKGAG